jgi:hypothetical protein
MGYEVGALTAAGSGAAGSLELFCRQHRSSSCQDITKHLWVQRTPGGTEKHLARGAADDGRLDPGFWRMTALTGDFRAD